MEFKKLTLDVKTESAKESLNKFFAKVEYLQVKDGSFEDTGLQRIKDKEDFIEIPMSNGHGYRYFIDKSQKESGLMICRVKK